MRTFVRTCVKGYTIEEGTEEGGYGIKINVEEGREYHTSSVKNGQVMVFSTYWYTVPAYHFDKGRLFTK